jgi:hypothetical protein
LLWLFHSLYCKERNSTTKRSGKSERGKEGKRERKINKNRKLRPKKARQEKKKKITCRCESVVPFSTSLTLRVYLVYEADENIRRKKAL